MHRDFRQRPRVLVTSSLLFLSLLVGAEAAVVNQTTPPPPPPPPQNQQQPPAKAPATVSQPVPAVPAAGNTITNNVVLSQDTYDAYRDLMDMKMELMNFGTANNTGNNTYTSSNSTSHNTTAEQQPTESEGLRTLKKAIMAILEYVRSSFLNGFLPYSERVRRDADGERKAYLDGVVYVVGALLGKQSCSDMIACKCGKIIQNKVPGSQLGVMMLETVVPVSMLNWFGVLKRSVLDRTEDCELNFDCTLTDVNSDNSHPYPPPKPPVDFRQNRSG